MLLHRREVCSSSQSSPLMDFISADWTSRSLIQDTTGHRRLTRGLTETSKRAPPPRTRLHRCSEAPVLTRVNARVSQSGSGSCHCPTPGRSTKPSIRSGRIWVSPSPKNILEPAAEYPLQKHCVTGAHHGTEKNSTAWENVDEDTSGSKCGSARQNHTAEFWEDGSHLPFCM